MNKAEEMRNLALNRMNYFTSHGSRFERKAYKDCLKIIKRASKRGELSTKIFIDETEYFSSTTRFCIHAVVERLANDGFTVTLIDKKKGDIFPSLEVSWNE